MPAIKQRRHGDAALRARLFVGGMPMPVGPQRHGDAAANRPRLFRRRHPHARRSSQRRHGDAAATGKIIRRRGIPMPADQANVGMGMPRYRQDYSVGGASPWPAVQGDNYVLLNFTHPLTETQRAYIESLGRQPITRPSTPRPATLITDRPFADQVRALADAWAGAGRMADGAILVNLARAHTIAAVCWPSCTGFGLFPPVVGLRRRPGRLPPRYQVAEI